MNKTCWEEKQSEAAAKKRQVELEKVEAEAMAAKEQEKVEADRKRAENEAARVKLREQIQKVSEQVQKVAPLLKSSIQDPVITSLICAARELQSLLCSPGIKVSLRIFHISHHRHGR